jgi:hypothetical protein
MRGGHHHVLHRQAGGLVYHFLRLIKDAATDHTTIRNDENELRFAIIERKTACVEFIVNDSGFAILETAVDRAAEFWRDVAGRGSGFEAVRRIGGVK